MEKSINRLIDHTLLRPEATTTDIDKLCLEAIEYDFASVCINPCWVKNAFLQCRNSRVKVCTVIGFPLGANTTDTKLYETEKSLDDGALEIDMVINIGFLKSGLHDLVQEEIRALSDTCNTYKALLKVIIETSLLTDQEKRVACTLAKEAGAHFVKTSTGFGASGATTADVALMRAAVGPTMGVKASGGVRDRTLALAMIDAGATRIGTSSGIMICNKSSGE